MDKTVIVQVNTYMVNIPPSKRKKHQVPFPKLMIIFSLYDLCHIPGCPWQILMVHLPKDQAYKTRTIYPLSRHTTHPMGTPHPGIDECIQVFIQLLTVYAQYIRIMRCEIALVRFDLA